MVMDGITVSTQSCTFSLFSKRPNKNYISLDSQIKMLYYDMNHVSFRNEIEVYTKREINNYKILIDFLNLHISVITGAKYMKFGRLVHWNHLEGIVSQIFYVCPSFYFM